MASPSARTPLLETVAAAAGGFTSRLRQGNLEAWAKLFDTSVLALQLVCVAFAVYLLVAPAPNSVCKTQSQDGLVILVEFVVQFVPMLIMCVVLYTTKASWDSSDVPQPTAAAFAHALSGIGLVAWLAVCIMGAPPRAVLLCGSLLAVVAAVVSKLTAGGRAVIA